MRLIKLTANVWRIDSTFAELGTVKSIRVEGRGAWWHPAPRCGKPRCLACEAGVGKSWWTGDPRVAEAFAGYADAETRADLQAAVSGRRGAIEASKAKDTSFEPPCPSGLAFLPFQKAGIEYAVGRTSALIADSMGLGKTCQAIGVLNILPASEARRVLVVCPASLRINWRREIERWSIRPVSIGIVEGSSWPEGAPNVTVINYDVLVRHEARLRAETWDVLIADECFPAGTLVDTPYGRTKIEDIRPGDVVMGAAGASTVRAISRRLATSLVRLRFSDGREVSCTPEHPFLTSIGWVRACDLNETHFIITSHEAMRVLRPVIRGDQEESEEPFLRHILLREMEDASTGCFGCVQDGRSPEGIRGEDETNPRGSSGLSRGVESEDDGEESDAYAWGDGQDNRHVQADRTQAAGQRGERYWPDGNGEDPAGTTPCPGVELRDPDGATEGVRVSNRVQGGPGCSMGYAGDRTGWGESQCAIAEGPRQKKDRASTRLRLVSSEVLEQIGTDEHESRNGCHHVYNLEVRGHPSYSVNGILVHNCHYAKNGKAQRSKALYAIPARRKLGLTGTPIVNRPVEFWPIASWLAPAEFPSWKRYVDRYCAPHQVWTPRGQITVYDGAANLEELQARSRASFMVRRLKDEVLTELPAKRRQVIPLPWNGSGPVVKALNAAWEAREAKLAVLRVEALGAADEEAYKAAVARLRHEEKIAFEEISEARKSLAIEKAPKAVAHIQGLLEDGGVSKVVAFVHHHAGADILTKGLAEFKPVVLTGETSMRDRQAAVDAFQNDPEVRVFIGSIGAAGVGITLTAASTVVFCELPWTPSEVSQAEDRCLTGDNVVFCPLPGYTGTMSIKKIKDISIGDMVLTHLGNVKRVSAVHERIHRGLLTTIDYVGWADPLVCTGDHKVLVRRDGANEWIQAMDVRPSDSVAFPKTVGHDPLRTIEIRPEWRMYLDASKPTECTAEGCGKPIEARGLCRSHYRELLRTNSRPPAPPQINGRYVRLPDTIRIDDEFLYLLGWYVADGFSSIKPGKSRFVSFSGHKDNRPTLEGFGQRLSIYGIKSTFDDSKSERTDGIEMRAYSGELAKWFYSWFGHGAHNKSLPKEIMDLPAREAGVFLRGYFDADGYTRGSYQEWVTASETLAMQICILVARTNRIPCLRRGSEKSGRHWVGGFSTADACDNWRLREQDDRYVYRPVRSVTTIHGHEPVYDITVEDDHSFVTGLCTVHNCHRIGQRDTVLVQHLVFDESLDAHMAKVIVAKQEVIDLALDAEIPLPELAPVVAGAAEGSEDPRKVKPTARGIVNIDITDEMREAVHAALRWLAGMCDGARMKDGAGFNRIDSAFGKALAGLPFLSDRQVLAGKQLVQKYQGQLDLALVRAAGIKPKGE